MKVILSTALLVGLCGLASGQGAKQDKKASKADPVGTWKCETEVNDVKRTSTLTIKKDGTKFSGTMTWQDKKVSKLGDVKFKDGELTFSAERELMENKFTIKYKLKIDGDKLTGKGEADFGGETRSFDVEGKREKKKDKKAKKTDD
jgi:hypothetical protein